MHRYDEAEPLLVARHSQIDAQAKDVCGVGVEGW